MRWRGDDTWLGYLEEFPNYREEGVQQLLKHLDDPGFLAPSSMNPTNRAN